MTLYIQSGSNLSLLNHSVRPQNTTQKFVYVRKVTISFITLSFLFPLSLGKSQMRSTDRSITLQPLSFTTAGHYFRDDVVSWIRELPYYTLTSSSSASRFFFVFKYLRVEDVSGKLTFICWEGTPGTVLRGGVLQHQLTTVARSVDLHFHGVPAMFRPLCTRLSTPNLKLSCSSADPASSLLSSVSSLHCRSERVPACKRSLAKVLRSPAATVLLDQCF